MNILFAINDIDFSEFLSTWGISTEISYEKVIMTLDGTERAYGKRLRDVITFAFLPFTEEECSKYYNTLALGTLDVKYTGQYGEEKNEAMRCISDLKSVFLLDSVDGKRRYKGGEIMLRQIGAH